MPCAEPLGSLLPAPSLFLFAIEDCAWALGAQSSPSLIPGDCRNARTLLLCLKTRAPPVCNLYSRILYRIRLQMEAAWTSHCFLASSSPLLFFLSFLPGFLRGALPQPIPCPGLLIAGSASERVDVIRFRGQDKHVSFA